MSASTPEGRVKSSIRKVLDTYGGNLDQYWPVPAGYGPSHLDCIVCFCGRFIAIEAKAPGKTPSPRQTKRINDTRRAGGIALVIDGTDKTDTLDDLRAVLEEIKNA